MKEITEKGRARIEIKKKEPNEQDNEKRIEKTKEGKSERNNQKNWKAKENKE